MTESGPRSSPRGCNCKEEAGTRAFSSPAPESGSKPKKLSGTTRKILSRLLKSGIPYNSALKRIQERIQTPSEQAGTSKWIRPSDDSSEATAEKPCTAESKPSSGETDGHWPSYGNAAACAKVGILHQDYPKISLKASHLESLQYAILAAIEDISVK
ncbi:hypothetical protein JTB14_035784 [Gonioctena quinquepunctata]|nr:hypothetical protein JTB14_035784 [Gonioctena quinquepunctata]